MLGDPACGLRIYVRLGQSDQDLSRLIRKLIGFYHGKPGTGMCAAPVYESDGEFEIIRVPRMREGKATGVVADADRHTAPDIAAHYEELGPEAWLAYRRGRDRRVEGDHH